MRWLYSTVLSTLLLLVLSTNATAQEVVKEFTQRTSTHAQPDYIKPGTNGKIYNLRGDFKMAGNTNLTLTNYTNDGNNSGSMSYVDIDLDGTTINSSSSFLDITNDACTEIVYAGLYWSGRANTGNMSFSVTGSVETGGTTTTQTLNHTHNGSNNLDATAVTISRAGSSNNYYPVQIVKIGDKEFEFTINNNGTVTKRERVNNGTWSGSTQVNVTVVNNLTNTNNITYSIVSNDTVTVGTGDNRVQTWTETSTATQIDENSGYKTFTLTTPIIYNYNSVNYTISSIRSYYTESSTRTTTATRTKTRDRWRFIISGWNPWSDWSNYSYGTWSLYSANKYNASEADFRTSTNNYVTIQGPKTSTGTTNYNGTLTKNIVKFKKEGGTYQNITANTSNIYYPSSNSNYAGIYAAYADVTEYVRANKGGNYFVADLATTAAADGSGTGYFGGWGLVVVYANPTMKWRDITVFDGYAFMQGNNYKEFSLSGFQAAQNGAVNITMGMMAAEGDVNIEGDNFRIQTGTSNSWTYLSHAGNATNNFFNSSIQVDGTRNPSLTNNTGIDIAKFDVPNPNNSIIGNGQTSTKFRYGSDGSSSSGNRDTYVIYNVVFAVDAYVPETEVFSVVTSPTGNAINNLQPNDIVTLTADIHNYGTDAVNNGKLQINIPQGMQLISAVVNTPSNSGANGTVNFGTPTWTNPVAGGVNGIPAATLGGVLDWDLGYIPTQALVGGLKVPLATLTYELKVTDDCMILQASKGNCILLAEVEGKITGKGVNSGANFEQVLITGYNTDCNNTPIYGGLNMEIKPLPTFLNSCSANNPNPVVNEVRMFKRFCSVPGDVIPRAEITEVYPAGTKFYTDAGVEVIGDFAVDSGGAVINYRAVLSGAPVSCYLKLATQLDVITTQPTTNDVTFCAGEPIDLNNTPSNGTYQLFYFQNQTDTTPMTGEPAPTGSGTFTYWVAEGTSNGSTTCFGTKKSFTITVKAVPTAATLANVELCTFADYVSTINANGATAAWEYYNGTAWVVVNTQLVGVAIVANQLKITKAPATLNGTKFRVKLTNTNNCSSVSNEMTLTVKGCQMPVNPMIYTPLKR